MRSTSKRFAALAVLTVLGLMSFVSQASAQDVRLRARATKVINGLETELRGDYRERNSSPNRLNSELENINIPVGTKVAVCLVQDGVTTKIGSATVADVAGRNVASLELEANDGDFVPKVKAGDVLQTRQNSKAPFKSNPGCNARLLIAAPFK
jgi:hypothetical protein